MKTFNTRINMLELVPKGGTFCELGTLKGDFSEIILAICNPKELVLVDFWPEKVMSGDVNGNNLEEFTGVYLKNYVVNRFKLVREVSIINKDTAKVLKSYPDNYFDAIYIDADHTYKAVVKDIRIAHKKIKNGGYIMGHDYEINPEKTDQRYEFGVKQAVDEYCQKENQVIFAKSKDGCVSFAIKVRK